MTYEKTHYKQHTVSGRAKRPQNAKRPQKMTPINYGLFLLGRRDYSIGEIRLKFQQHYEPEEMTESADEIIERFVELGYLNDQRFAEGFVRREARRLQGPNKIRAALLQKKVALPFIEAALAEVDWSEICQETLTAKSQKYQDADKGKIYRFLAARGFSSDHIQDSLRSHVKALDDVP